MKIAYLITVHNQPKHLARLIRNLNTPQATFYIHVDAKVEEAPFRDAISLKNVIFISNRVKMHWGGCSLVKGTLSLLREAYPHHDRFCLLSGADFPIKPNSHILEVLASDTEYIRIDRRLDGSDNHSANVGFYWLMEHPWTERFWGRIRRKPFRMPLYHGSQWWALTNSCVGHILSFIDENRDYLRYFRFVRYSDEIFFHSIIRNSPFAAKISHDFDRVTDPEAFAQSCEYGAHFIDWNMRGPSRPKVLDIEDLERLLASNAVFARKFSEDDSHMLLTLLEQEITEPSCS